MFPFVSQFIKKVRKLTDDSAETASHTAPVLVWVRRSGRHSAEEAWRRRRMDAT